MITPLRLTTALVLLNVAMFAASVMWIAAAWDIAAAIRESAPVAPVPCSAGPVGVLPEGS